MLNLNNYVATSVSCLTTAILCQTWIETSEKCKKKIFSNPYLNTKSVDCQELLMT